MSSPLRAKQADELVRRFAAALRGVQLYAPTHPLVARSVTALAEALAPVLATTPSIAIGIIGEDLVVGDIPVPRAAESMGKLTQQLQQVKIERIVIEQGVQLDELTELIQTLGASDATPESTAVLAQLTHVRVGRIEVDDAANIATADMATCRRLYEEAVIAAETLWESARTEGMPDANTGREAVDSLAHEVSQNRTALLALTALKEYDSYTFTHMVNVSILTMGQARGLGIDGTLLREFGLSALLHDIGKVRTPTDILNNPGQLTETEIEIMRRHPVDGAAILRRTPEIPTLAPVVAFEHHLRLDGSGYPFGTSPPTLNLGTMLCGIADVYDAMRSQRVYQPAFPTDRILAVLEQNDGTRFDQHLVRRFVQLVGIYPVGNLVRLESGEIAVVLQTHAPSPYRPRVRVVRDASGKEVHRGREINLWDESEGPRPAIQAPVDPADYGIDPLTYL
ncbi:MAG: HD-GYP domain-containing protein [Acidobacteria bacterium]|nr:HD-GYP domain-containing protein [Acidobacteriota bacterium]